MSGPVPFARNVQSLDRMMDAIGGPGWGGLDLAKALGLPGSGPDGYAPDDALKKEMAAFYQTASGRRMIEWLADLTLRGPPGASGNTIASSAIAHAKHEARYAVGQAILQAIQDGDKLLNPTETRP